MLLVHAAGMVHVSIDFSKVVKVSICLLSIGGMISCCAQTGAESSVKSNINKGHPSFTIKFLHLHVR